MRLLCKLDSTFRQISWYLRKTANHRRIDVWASNRVDRKSVSGGIPYFNGRMSRPDHWLSKRQTTVTFSSPESEGCATYAAWTGALHIWTLISDIVQPELPFQIYCDNQEAKCITEQGTDSVRSKWFDTRVHLLLRNWFASKQDVQVSLFLHIVECCRCSH